MDALKKIWDKIFKRGIHLWTLNIGIILIVIVLYGLMLWHTEKMEQQYHSLIESANENLSYVQLVRQMTAGSDYLTEQARFCIFFQNPSYIQKYFHEVNVTRRRDSALEQLSEMADASSQQTFEEQLKHAMTYSNELMEREIYAMKLVMTANNFSEWECPQEMQSMRLTPEDLALSSNEMMTKARQMLFDEEYWNAKALIESCTEFCVNHVMDQAEAQRKQSESQLQQVIFNQRLIITLLFVVNVTIFIGILLFVIRPIQGYIACIREGRPLHTGGTAEFQYMAQTYNDIFEKNKANERILQKYAEQDSLTELFNRRVFNQMSEKLQNSSEKIGLLIMDVDVFKTVNDKYGHETGDYVLKRVADLLCEYFGKDDIVIRLGGDEFAVIMTNISQDQKNAAAKKIEQINRLLKEGDDILPPVSLSAGMAVSKCGFSDSLYRRADAALYMSKKEGKNRCIFSDEI